MRYLRSCNYRDRTFQIKSDCFRNYQLGEGGGERPDRFSCGISNNHSRIENEARPHKDLRNLSGLMRRDLDAQDQETSQSAELDKFSEMTFFIPRKEFKWVNPVQVRWVHFEVEIRNIV